MDSSAEMLCSSVHIGHSSQSSLTTAPIWDLTIDDFDTTADAADILKSFQSSQSRSPLREIPPENKQPIESVPVTPIAGQNGMKMHTPSTGPSPQSLPRGFKSPSSHKKRKNGSAKKTETSTPNKLYWASFFNKTSDLGWRALSAGAKTDKSGIEGIDDARPRKRRLIIFSDDEDLIEDGELVDGGTPVVVRLPKVPKRANPSRHPRRTATRAHDSPVRPFEFRCEGSLHSVPFDERQDAKIIEMHELSGDSWETMSPVLGRTPAALCQRYKRHLKPGARLPSYREPAVRLLHRHGLTMVSLSGHDPGQTRYRTRKTISRASFSKSVIPVTSFERTEDEVAETTASKFMRDFSDRVGRMTRERKGQLPYLSRHERRILESGFSHGVWADVRRMNVDIHVGFSADEIAAVLRCVRRFFGDKDVMMDSLELSDYADDLTSPATRAISAYAPSEPGLEERSRSSIESFLHDLMIGPIPETVERVRFKGTVKSQKSAGIGSVSEMLWEREQGTGGYGRCHKSEVMENIGFDTLGARRFFMGTSGAVISIAWAANSNMFVVGSVSPIDPDSLQYNCPLNLVVGDVEEGSLVELPDHKIARTRPESGPNSTAEMFASQDPDLYSTVSNVAFSPDGALMYSGGYDRRLRVWETGDRPGKMQLRWTFDTKAEVELMAVNQTNGLLAVASKRIEKSIRLYDFSQSEYTIRPSFFSSRAVGRPDLMIYPSALEWGRHPWDEHLLAGGFMSGADEERVENEGHLAVWNVESGSAIRLPATASAVFDCCWSPFGNTLAAGVVDGSVANREVRSVVKLFEMSGSNRLKSTCHLDCPAYDINQVEISRLDEHIVTAGCTNGTVYVWDVRQPTKPVHLLIQDEPVTPLNPDVHPEYTDTGVKFMLWGANRSRLFTGGSDGKVKSWDIYRAPEDVFVNDVAQFCSAIMAGSFNGDYSRLLIGEDAGGVCVLELGHEGTTYKTAEQFAVQRAPTRFSAPFTADDAAVESKSTKTASSSTRSKFFSKEDITDSGRTGGRTPFGLLYPTERALIQRRRIGLSRLPPRPPVSRCIKCQLRPSRPFMDRGRAQLSTVSASEAMLERTVCEVCDFACVSCGRRANVDVKAGTVNCENCEKGYSVGCVGYQDLGLVGGSSGLEGKSTVGSDDQVEKRLDASRLVSRSHRVRLDYGETRRLESDEEDEIEDLDEHFHSLWGKAET